MMGDIHARPRAPDPDTAWDPPEARTGMPRRLHPGPSRPAPAREAAMSQFSSRLNIAEARREIDSRRAARVIRVMRTGLAVYLSCERGGPRCGSQTAKRSPTPSLEGSSRHPMWLASATPYSALLLVKRLVTFPLRNRRIPMPDEAMKPKLKVAAADPFDPENLRLSQAFVDIAGVKKLLTTVPVRKPSPQDFVRVHPSPEYRENFPMIELKDEREEYIVTANLVPELIGEFVTKTLFTAINRQGTIFFWPIRLPSPDGKDLDWWRSGREAAELATKSWIRARANMNLGAYDIFKAESVIADPEWPELGFWELIRIAFKDHLIDRIDHPVVKRLRGQV
jgi:hypothetical protein